MQKFACLIIVEEFCFPVVFTLIFIIIIIWFNNTEPITSVCFIWSFVIWCWLETLLIAKLEMEYRATRIRETCFGILRHRLHKSDFIQGWGELIEKYPALEVRRSWQITESSSVIISFLDYCLCHSHWNIFACLVQFQKHDCIQKRLIFIFNKYFLAIYYVLSSMLSNQDRAVKKVFFYP